MKRGIWHGKWASGVLFREGSAIGCVGRCRDGWEAYGAESKWQDTPLGKYATESAAKTAVQRWVSGRG